MSNILHAISRLALVLCTLTATFFAQDAKACYANFNHTNACVGDTVWFYGLDTYAAHAWDFGDNTLGLPNTAFNDTAYHAYTAPGDYYVTHFVNIGAEWAYETQLITIGTTCFAAAFDFDCGAFINQSVGSNLSCSWDFGDPASLDNTSTQFTPYHYYTNAGTYTVTLTVTDGTNTQTVSHDVTYDPMATCLDASISYFYNACAGDTTQFYAYYSSDVTAVLWNFGDPTSGINNLSTELTPMHHYSQPGQYPVTLIYTNGIATDTLHWLAYVIDCNVWAGDVNQDGEVTASDIFPLGIYYGDAGTARLNASANWEAQPSTDWGDTWQEMYLQRMVNKKHADANGDGIINALDAETVAINFGNTHYQHNNQSEMQLLNASDPTLALNLPQNTFTDGSTIDVPITLGNQAIPATGVYGYAFTVQYPQAMVINATVTFDNSWLGDANELITLQNNDTHKGELHLAAVRTQHTNANGNGTIATLHLTLGYNVSGSFDLTIRPDAKICSNTMPVGGWATNQQVMLNAHLQNANADVISTGIDTPNANMASLYPNPATNQLFVQLNNQMAQSISIKNTLGQTMVQKNIDSNQTISTINIAQLPAGLYFVQINTTQGTLIQRFVKQ